MIRPPDPLPDSPDALRAIIAAQQEQLVGLAAAQKVFEATIEALKATIARLRRQRYGASSEKIDREIEQLELALEGLQLAAPIPPADDPEGDPDPSGTQADADGTSREEPARRRRPRVAADTEREQRVLSPGTECPDCGGTLRLLGEDVSEILDYVAAKLKLIEIRRPRLSCRQCERVVQTPAPTRPVKRGMASANLLAHILIAKFDDHLPLYRQGEIFARMGADIPRSTLIDWCGQAAKTLTPVADRIAASLFAGNRLHADDTPVRVLDPGVKRAGKERGVKEGRIWVYVRDDRPWAGTDPPAAVYRFSPDRKGQHPQNHLAGFSGILQADAYAGFRALYAPDASGDARVVEAACWAHLRRDFHDVWKATGSTLAREALEKIGGLYDIEARIAGRPEAERLAVRQTESRPRVEAFRAWCDRVLPTVSGKSDLAKAIRYATARWASFTRFLDDGRIAIDNNPAERAMKPIALGRKNFLFAGSDAGGEILATAMTVIETAKLNGLDPEAYIADLLQRLPDTADEDIDDLLPWNRRPAEAELAA